jgi:hypothetical protein
MIVIFNIFSTLRITALGITDLIMTLSISENQNNDIMDYIATH